MTLIRVVAAVLACACFVFAVPVVVVSHFVESPALGGATIGAAGLILMGLYYALSRFHHRRPDLGDLPQIIEPPIWDVIARADELSTIQTREATTFLYLMVEPNSFIDRISESVEPMTRSVSTTTTLSMHVEGYEGDRLVVPVVLRQRGSTADGLRFAGPSDERLSSLIALEVNAYCLAVIRRVLASVSPVVLAQYLVRIEPSVAVLISRDKIASLAERDAVLGAIQSLAPEPAEAVQILAVVKLVRTLFARQPICVPVVLERPSSPVIDSEPVTSHTFRIRLTARRRTTVKYEVSSGLPAMLDGWARVLFGIREASLNVPLVNAARAKSYHLQVLGLENTFLASQTILRNRVVTRFPAHVVAEVRRGQRHGHLYISGALRSAGYDYHARFFERMPGSMGPAAMSALSVAILTWLAYSAVGRVDSDLFNSWEYPTLVLAFPAAISIWVGVETEKKLLQGVLAARVSTISTIAFAIAAAWLSITAHVAGTEHQWLVLACFASLNAAIALFSWFSRSRVQAYFLNRSLPSDEFDDSDADETTIDGAPA